MDHNNLIGEQDSAVSDMKEAGVSVATNDNCDGPPYESEGGSSSNSGSKQFQVVTTFVPPPPVVTVSGSHSGDTETKAALGTTYGVSVREPHTTGQALKKKVQGDIESGAALAATSPRTMPGVARVQQEAHIAANRVLRRKKGLGSDKAEAKMTSTSPQAMPGVANVQNEDHIVANQTLRRKGLGSDKKAEAKMASTSSGATPGTTHVRNEEHIAANQALRKKGLGRQKAEAGAESRAARDSPPAGTVLASAAVSRAILYHHSSDAHSEVAGHETPPEMLEVSQLEAQEGEGNLATRALPVEAMLVDDDNDRQRLREELRNEMFHEAVIGEAIKANDENESPLPRTNRKKSILCGILIFAVFLMVAIILSFSLGSRNSSSSSSLTESPTTSSPTVSSHPSMSPTTVAPTVSNHPSLSPTASSPPSASPTTSSSPTIPNESRDNTNRSEAQFLELNAPPLEALVSGFGFQGVGGSCRRRKERRRGLYGFFGRFCALWYTYTARASGPVSAIACGPVSFHAYQNSYNCLSDGVYDGVHGNNGDIGNCGGTSFSWEAKEGETYTLLVYLTNMTCPGHPNQPAADQEDDDVVTIQIVDNDHCGNAFGPIIPTSVGTTVSYTTLGAQVDGGEVQASCGGSTAPKSSGVWYTARGTGLPLTASTCGEETAFDTQISVFTGDCSNLVCVNGNDNLCGEQSSVDWRSLEDEVYYILVHGGSPNSAGAFQLTVSTDFVRLENDFCLSATEVSLDNVTISETIPFSLAGSTADPDVPLCQGQTLSNDNEGNPYGIWYVFQGNGSPLHISYQVYSGQAFGVRVYTGSCGGLACLEETNAYLSGTTSYFWTDLCFETNSEETYYIFLSTGLLRAIDEQNGEIKFGPCVLDSAVLDAMCGEISDCRTCQSTQVPHTTIGGSTCSWYGDQGGYCSYLPRDAEDTSSWYCPEQLFCEQAPDCNSCVQLQIDVNTTCTWANGVCSDWCPPFSATESCYSHVLFPALNTEDICQKYVEFDADLALCEAASETCENCTSTLKSDGRPCEWHKEWGECQYGYDGSEYSSDTCDAPP